MPDPVKALSDAIIEPITKAYRVGGFGLSFLLLGAIMLLAAALIPIGYFMYPLALIGFVLVVIPCYFFYVKEIRPISKAQRSLARSSDVIDTVQAAALQITGLAYDLQSLAFRYATEIETAIKIIRPQIRIVPGIGKIADLPLMRETENLAGRIVSSTRGIDHVVSNVKQALIDSDPKLLKVYIEDMKRIGADLEALLASPILSSENKGT